MSERFIIWPETDNTYTVRDTADSHRVVYHTICHGVPARQVAKDMAVYFEAHHPDQVPGR